MLKSCIIIALLISPSCSEDASLIKRNNHSNERNATDAAYFIANHNTTSEYRTARTNISTPHVLIDNSANKCNYTQESKHIVNVDHGIIHERNMQVAFAESNEFRNGLLNVVSSTSLNENDSRRLYVVKPKRTIHEYQSTIKTIKIPTLSLPASSSSSPLSSMTKQKQNRNNSQKGIESPFETTFETPIVIFQAIPTLSSSTVIVPMSYEKGKKQEMDSEQTNVNNIKRDLVSTILPSIIPFHTVRLNFIVNDNDDSAGPKIFQIR